MCMGVFVFISFKTYTYWRVSRRKIQERGFISCLFRHVPPPVLGLDKRISYVEFLQLEDCSSKPVRGNDQSEGRESGVGESLLSLIMAESVSRRNTELMMQSWCCSSLMGSLPAQTFSCFLFGVFLQNKLVPGLEMTDKFQTCARNF